MSHEGLNTIDPTVAQRWIGDIERRYVDLLSERGLYMARCKDIRDDIADYIERAVAAGLNRQALKKKLKIRELDRKIQSIEADAELEVKEQLELLTEALGDFANLPLGEAAVNAPARRAAKNAAAPGTIKAGMTLAEAKAILEKPKGRGRPPAQRVEAERVVEAAKQVDLEEAIATKAMDGASGEQAAQIADAMGPDDAQTGDVTEVEEEDLRPPFLRAVN